MQPSEHPSDVARVANRRGRLSAVIGGQPVPYVDVPVEAWYAPYVAVIIEEGIAQGYKDEHGNPKGEFSSVNLVTYEELAKMVVEARGEAVSATARVVPQNLSARFRWSEQYVRRSEELQLSVFRSDLDVTRPASRGAVVQTVLEALDFPIARQLPAYTDVSPDHPNASAIATAAFFGLVSGDTDASGLPLNTFRPDAPINRAEVAKVIAVMREVMR